MLGDTPQAIAIDLGPRFAVVPRRRPAGAGRRDAHRDRPDRRRRTRRRPARHAAPATAAARARDAAAARSASGRRPAHDRHRPGPRRRRRRRERDAGDAREDRHAGGRATAEGRDRGAAGRARAADARRRRDRRPRSARRRRQQQQGGSVHQPARQRVGAAGRGRAPRCSTWRSKATASEAQRAAQAPRDIAAGRRRRHARHRSDSLGDGAGALHRSVGGVRARDRERAARPRADEPAVAAAGAVPRAGRRQHAGRARRDRAFSPTRSRNSSSLADEHQNALAQALVDGIVRFRAGSGGTR